MRMSSWGIVALDVEVVVVVVGWGEEVVVVVVVVGGVVNSCVAEVRDGEAF